MTKLTDTQLVALSAAADRADGAILPLPANLKGGAVAKVIEGLIGRGLAERIASDRAADPGLVRITPAGLAAIGIEPDETVSATGEPAPDAGGTAETKPRRRREGTKQARLIELLRRPAGATIAEAVQETGRQPHSVRGAIAGALKRRLGLEVTSEKVAGRGRVYRVAEPD